MIMSKRRMSVAGFCLVLAVAFTLPLGVGCAKKQPDVDLPFVTGVLKGFEQYKKDKAQVAELREAILSLEEDIEKVTSGKKPLKEGVSRDEWLQEADVQLAYCRDVLQKAEKVVEEYEDWLLSVKDKFGSEYAKAIGK
jgi:hypothetical protein